MGRQQDRIKKERQGKAAAEEKIAALYDKFKGKQSDNDNRD